MAPSRHSVSFNIMMTPDESQWLHTLSQTRRVSQAQILRDALQAKYTMEIAHQPSCASGVRCLVPQMHAPAPPAPNG